MSVTWDEYLSVPDAPGKFGECRTQCHASYLEQRKRIERLIEATKPETVACLGAGGLNDIPYATLIRSGAAIQLVDWVPGSIDAGIDLSIIQTDEDGAPRCVYCDPTVQGPERYCRHFHDSSPRSRVCEQYRPVSQTDDRCAVYERGEEPSVHYEDATAGYASAFGRCIFDELQTVRTWKQAFARAWDVADRVRRHRTSLSIKDASVQLVTSSMIVSQFEHEPYGFFARRAADRLGPPSVDVEQRLASAMESLRSTLFASQVERHCQEIKRILTPDGYCYMSFEFFHAMPGRPHWFMVQGVATAMEIISQHFTFNFDNITESELVTRFQTGDEPSMVLSMVLQAHPK